MTEFKDFSSNNISFFENYLKLLAEKTPNYLSEIKLLTDHAPSLSSENLWQKKLPVIKTIVKLDIEWIDRWDLR